MDYNEFLLKAQYDLAAAMPGAVISREQISKLQGESYEGFSVRSEGSMTGVMLNMEAMYKRLEAGTDYNQTLSDMLDIMDDNSTSVSQGIVDFLSDYSQVKENLTVDLVGQAQNEDRLSDIPHYDMEDLSLIYRVDVSDRVQNDGGRATVLVTNQMLERYGITPEQLHQDALENTSRKEPLIITGLGNVLLGLIGKDINVRNARNSGLYISSNLSMMYGAATIAYSLSPSMQRNMAFSRRICFCSSVISPRYSFSIPKYSASCDFLPSGIGFFPFSHRLIAWRETPKISASPLKEILHLVLTKLNPFTFSASFLLP